MREDLYGQHELPSGGEEVPGVGKAEAEDGEGPGRPGPGGAAGGDRGRDKAAASRGRRGRRGRVGGFYARCFSDEELAELAGAGIASIDDEVALLKIAIRRAVEEGADLRELAAGTDALGRALKVQYGLKGKAAQGLDEALARALDEIGKELGMAL